MSTKEVTDEEIIVYIKDKPDNYDELQYEHFRQNSGDPLWKFYMTTIDTPSIECSIYIFGVNQNIHYSQHKKYLDFIKSNTEKLEELRQNLKLLTT